MEEQAVEPTNGAVSADVEDCGFVIPADNDQLNTDDETMEEARSKTSDASIHDSVNVLFSPTRSSSRSHEADSKRKFRIMGLKHPGDWRKHEKLQDMLARSEQFHIWFDPNPKKGIKTGGVSLTFDCPEAARIAFSEAQKFVIDGVPVKMLASRSFYEPSRRPLQSFSISEDVELKDRTLYAVYLLESTSAEVLDTIFSDIEKVEFLPLAENRKQAELVMQSKEAAITAKADGDGFDLSDGESSSIIKVMFSSEYADFISLSSRPPMLSPTLSSSSLIPPLSRSNSNASSCSKPALSPTKTHHKETERATVKPPAPPPAPLPLPSEIPELEPSMSEVGEAIHLIVEEERINWAEINEREELYTLVDKASYKLGGVRDELLRDSLLSVMESSRAAADDSNWMRRHLDGLIKLWKKEITSGVPFNRSTRVPLQARIINPLPKEKKRKRGGGAAARAQFGLGAVLAAARAKFATEEGELDIEETNDGGILIGDVPLSFESWARFNKQPLKRAPPKEEKIPDNSNSKDNRRIKRAKMEEEKKKKKEEQKAKKEADKPLKELEEGEMDSDESGGGGDGKGGSSSSSSSSSESDEEGDSRRRRRFRRKNDRNKPPSLPPLFQSIYDNRVSIISQLSIEHRVAFSKVLTQFVNQKGGIDSNQQKDLVAFMNMSSFGR